MPLVRPYYRLHQIIPGQYASLGELVTADGEDYEGPYHVLPNGHLFTGYRPADSSQPLFYKRVDLTDTAKQYNRVKGRTVAVSNYTAPKFYVAAPTRDDYAQGFMYRYFAQKRNSPLSSIVEISYEDFTQANLSNAPGISLGLYNIQSVMWRVSRVSRQEATALNMKAVQQAEREFPGLTKYLSDLSEFYQ